LVFIYNNCGEFKGRYTLFPTVVTPHTLLTSGRHTARGPYVVQTYFKLLGIIVVLLNNFVRPCIVSAKYRTVKHKDGKSSVAALFTVMVFQDYRSVNVY